MSLKNAVGIYHVLTQKIKDSSTPLTCVDLFDDADVRALAEDANKVSDYLGHMYRRNLLGREPAPPGSGAARYAYFWKDAKLSPKEIPKQRHAQPRLTLRDLSRVPTQQPQSAARSTKPNVKITESGNTVTLEFASFILTIESK